MIGLRTWMSHTFYVTSPVLDGCSVSVVERMNPIALTPQTQEMLTYKVVGTKRWARTNSEVMPT